MTQGTQRRILLVDDAVVVRKTLSDAICQDPGLAVVGTAANGRIALAKFSTLKPDVILLDTEMPEMDGLQTVREIRKLDRTIPIIMFSTLTERGAAATLEALSLGATDYVTKPAGADVPSASQIMSRELIPKIRALCHLPDQSIAVHNPATAVHLAKPPQWRQPVQVVAIGVSTGGPDALARILPVLPADLPVPVVIAQHMPRTFTSLLAARLSAKSALPVRECESGEALTPGCVFLAPGDSHMLVERNGGARLLTHQGPKENFCRPSVDILFRSVALAYGSRTLAIVLTGMGQDGLKGCEILHEKGARIVVQDEASSVVWGMPGYVAEAGLAEKVLPLDQIGPEIVRATSLHRAARR